MAVLQTSKLYKDFGPVEVLKDINLSIEEGDFLVLVGPSGCGKSTLLNIIAGLETASGGDVLIDDRVVNEVAPKDRDIAMVFQSYALYPTMTVEKNITFGMRVRNVPRQEREEALQRVAKLLHIEPLLRRKPSQLSGGQRQRVAMGRALVRRPKLFLFDEPLSNLDAKLRSQMRSEIKQLHQKFGATIVYVTHDQTEAMSLATKIAVMSEGEIIQLGAPQELYDRPNSVFVADFIGSPAMNLFRGRIEARDAKPHFVASHDGTQVALPIDHYDFGSDLRDDQELVLGIRPEYVTSGIGNHHGGVSVDFELVPLLMETNGFDQHVMFEFCGGELVGRFSSKESVDVGRPHRVHLDLSEISLFDAVGESRICRRARRAATPRRRARARGSRPPLGP
jgi:multiple sugar transport system ATP-binding protein